MNWTRLPKFQRGAPFDIEVNGRRLIAYEGETVATTLLAANIQHFHPAATSGGEPSRLYCGMTAPSPSPAGRCRALSPPARPKC